MLKLHFLKVKDEKSKEIKGNLIQRDIVPSPFTSMGYIY